MLIRLTLLLCAFLYDHGLVGYGLPAVERLEQDSGMAAVAEQDPEKSYLERIVLALTKAGERYRELPEAERVYDPVRSAQELGRALIAMQAIYSTQFDIEKARECCARFEPLAALTPMAKLCHDSALAAIDALIGRIEPALALQQDVVVRAQALLASMQANGADPQQVVVVRALLASMAYVVALRLLFTNPQESQRMADLIDHVAINRHKAGAAQLRVLASYMLGDADAAARFQAEYEQRLVRFRQHGSSGIDLSYRLRAYELGGDLLGLNAVGREIESIVERRPGYRPFLHLCRGHTFTLRAEHERALDEFMQAAELAQPGRHMAWASAISQVARSLVELGRLTEARACIERARHDNAAHDLGGTLDALLVPALALLEAFEGDLEGAQRRLQEALRLATEAGHPLLARAELLLPLLRVAVTARDRALFKRHAAELRELYRNSDHRGLHAAYKRLLERARAEQLIESAPGQTAPQADAGERSKVAAVLGACTDSTARAGCALTLLVEALQASSGYLFVLRRGRLELAATPRDRSRATREHGQHARRLSQGRARRRRSAHGDLVRSRDRDHDSDLRRWPALPANRASRHRRRRVGRRRHCRSGGRGAGGRAGAELGAGRGAQPASDPGRRRRSFARELTLASGAGSRRLTATAATGYPQGMPPQPRGRRSPWSCPAVRRRGRWRP